MVGGFNFTETIPVGSDGYHLAKGEANVNIYKMGYFLRDCGQLAILLGGPTTRRFWRNLIGGNLGPRPRDIEAIGFSASNLPLLPDTPLILGNNYAEKAYYCPLYHAVYTQMFGTDPELLRKKWVGVDVFTLPDLEGMPAVQEHRPPAEPATEPDARMSMGQPTNAPPEVEQPPWPRRTEPNVPGPFNAFGSTDDAGHGDNMDE